MTRLNRLSYSSPSDPVLKRGLIKLVEQVSGRPKIEKLYDQILKTDLSSSEIWGKALEMLSVELDLKGYDLDNMKIDGPLILIANHPFGVVDGLILGHLGVRLRKEIAILVNELLCKQDERLAKSMLPIDFNETKEAILCNIQTKKTAIERLRRGDALLIFPSGGVATSPKPFGKAEDLEWKRFTAKLIQISKATVIPIFVHGQNSWIFHLASKWSLALRYGLLIHEVKNKMGKKIEVTIGAPIPFDELSAIKDRQKLLDHLREITFALGAEKH